MTALAFNIKMEIAKMLRNDIMPAPIYPLVFCSFIISHFRVALLYALWVIRETNASMEIEKFNVWIANLQLGKHKLIKARQVASTSLPLATRFGSRLTPLIRAQGEINRAKIMRDFIEDYTK